MTRINCIPPAELTGKHLVSEYRELPRIFTLALQAIGRGEEPDDPRNPDEYVLGTGHCRFFYTRLRYLERRHAALIKEMGRRGYQNSFPAVRLTHKLDPRWRRDWKPTPEAMALNRARIAQRIEEGGS